MWPTHFRCSLAENIQLVYAYSAGNAYYYHYNIPNEVTAGGAIIEVNIIFISNYILRGMCLMCCVLCGVEEQITEYLVHIFRYFSFPIFFELGA